MKRPLIAIALLILAGLATVFYLDSRVPRATATVQVHPARFASNAIGMTRSYMENEYEIILAQETRRLAATLLGIEKNQQAEAIQLMGENITTAPVRGTDFITITAKYPDPQQAAKIANAIAEAYAQRRSTAERDRAERAIAALDEELETQRELVATHKEKLVSLIQAYTPPLLDENGNPGDLSFRQNAYNKAKENYLQSREMLQDMKTQQQEARVLLKMPRDPITIHERAK